MRIGLVLAENDAVELAVAADSAGIAAVRVPAGALGTGVTEAAAIAVATTDTRIAIEVLLGTEHPVTLAEEVAVLDQLSGGRIVAVIAPGQLSEDEAAEDLSLLLASWSGRWVSHHGARWNVPSGTHDDMPTAIAVTPLPAQLELPVWLDAAAPELAGRAGLPVFVGDPAAAAAAAESRVVPGTAELSGELDADRELVLAWARAGATHLFVTLPPSLGTVAVERYLARYLVPEATMPHFPRIVAEAAWPAQWP